MLELAEEGSLDEAVKPRAPSLFVQCARRVLGHGTRIVDQVSREGGS